MHMTMKKEDPLYSVGSLATIAYAAAKMKDRRLGAVARDHLDRLYGVKITVSRESIRKGDDDVSQD